MSVLVVTGSGSADEPCTPCNLATAGGGIFPPLFAIEVTLSACNAWPVCDL